MNGIYKIFINILLFIIVFHLYSEKNRPLVDTSHDTKKSPAAKGITVYIELAHPQIFKQGDEVTLNVKIFNASNENRVLFIASDKKFSFDFQMVTMENRMIEHSKEYIISFHRVQPIFNTHILLSPNEAYLYKIRLNDYFDIDKTGQFFIKAAYYPELKLNNDLNAVIYSNQIAINIRPGEIEEKYVKEKEEVEVEKKLYAAKRPPDEAVKYMLDGRIHEEWEKFFLYLDLEKLILTNYNFKEKFIKADYERQQKLIEQYKNYLKKNVIGDISFLPVKYEILKTEYAKGEGKVDAILYFKTDLYTEKKYYTYFLEQKDNIWYIDNYEILNLNLENP